MGESALPWIVVDAGHREHLHKEKRLSQFVATVGTMIEVRHHKGRLTADVLHGASAIWFFGPATDLAVDEVPLLDELLAAGGAVFILMNTPLPVFGEFLGRNGITLGGQIISPVYIEYVDPGHISVQKGVLNSAVQEFVGIQNPTFAFPNCVGLEVKPPAVSILGSGQSSFPLNRPVLAVREGRGIMVCSSSVDLFSDDWLKLESNIKLLRFLVEYAIFKTVKLNAIEAQNPEPLKRVYTPDVGSMAARLRSCVQESEKLRPNFVENFDAAPFRMDLATVTAVDELSANVGLKTDPLEMVAPQFDTALPPLTPAVFPPQMKDPGAPVLELFDLDDAFASPKTRLAQLAQRTDPKNAEKFAIQAARILGILPKLPRNKQTGQGVLEYVFAQIATWKRAGVD